jgi:hypothetical protein
MYLSIELEISVVVVMMKMEERRARALLPISQPPSYCFIYMLFLFSSFLKKEKRQEENSAREKTISQTHRDSTHTYTHTYNERK